MIHNYALGNDSGSFIPWRVRRALEPAAFSTGMFAFRHGFRNRRVFHSLRMGWGNEGWSADTSYLEAVCRYASRVRGPILECGSGLTTILLGVVARDRITSLEQMPAWKEHVQLVAKKYSVPVNVVSAPLVDYGDFHWYTMPESQFKQYDLVICDGPPSATLGGRYGLLPIARRLLSRTAIVLMDDAERPSEQGIIERWKSEFGIHCEERRTACGSYAEIRLEKSEGPE
jgi:hypothetical protein